MRTFLTKSGLLSQAIDTGNGNFYAAFFSNTGEFRRECSVEEFEHLSKQLPEISLSKNEVWDKITDAFGNFPIWHKIATIAVCDDYSRYRWETCNNGGDYSYHTTQEWFAGRMPNGEWKFCKVDSFSTSAEFSYDELSGSFQQNLGNLVITNCSEPISYRTQTGRDEEGWICDEYRVLEQISEEGKFADLWNAIYTRIEREEKEFYALSLSQKKEIVVKLKELGWRRTDKKKGR